VTVHEMLARLVGDEEGQALAEYGIVLAIMGAIPHIEYYARDMLSNPNKMLLVGLGIGVAVFLLSSRRR
jgi:hypothetical protein